MLFDKIIKKYLSKFYFYFLFSTLFFFLIPKNVLALDVKADYEINYFIKKIENRYQTEVSYFIKFTNLKSDIYLSKFNISFPADFKVKNIEGYSNEEKIETNLINENEKLKIELKINNSKIGKNEINILRVNFIQENLLKEFGEVWELMIPNIVTNGNEEVKIIFNLPNLFNKKISIAKPKPNLINNLTDKTQIIWNNPKEKTIYTIFGEKQYYYLNLTYNIKNDKPYPVFTEIAFPPDTLYQKVYLESINPLPKKLYSDEDGNFLGKIFLLPGEVKKINFLGVIELFVKPRDDLRAILNDNLISQKKYLLTTDDKYWQIEPTPEFQNLDSAEKIYYYVINKLDYNYKKLNKKKTRLGAQEVIKNPNNSVCTEFTDLFIAIAREKGILAREIQGYGFSHESYLRPISLVSDILHSWVEYYDEKKQIWVPIDPTWEETSGIDYFNFFDLNHIAFVIHGKNPNYPHPAGMYKLADSKDILVNIANQPLKEKKDLLINLITFPNPIYADEKYKIKLKIINKGNTYLWNMPIELTGSNIQLSEKKINISYMVPMEERDLEIEFLTSNIFTLKKGSLRINYLNKTLKKDFNIFPFYFISIKFIIIFLFFLIFLVLILKNGVFSKKS